ncbi:MAG TPA: hypothetical protein VF855_08265 [Acidimicrobiales bacterium]
MPVPSSDNRIAARRLAGLLEPVIGQVYFSPECHAAYEALGFGPSSGLAGSVALPNGPAYFTSRGSVMGQVPGEVVAAAFAVFNPAAVVPSVTLGWTITDAPTICRARDVGALAQLQRILGTPDELGRASELLARMVEPLTPEGRPLFAGLRSLPDPDHAWGALWRAGDRLREYRGDCHTASWISAGFDAVEIGLLTELWIGLPMKTYVRTRAWSEEQLDAGIERLTAAGLVAGGAFTDEGRERRGAVEQATDRQMAPALSALGDDADELFAILEPWGRSIREAGGYLKGAADLHRG